MDEVKAALDAAIASGDTVGLQAASDKLALPTKLEDATAKMIYSVIGGDYHPR